MLKKVAFFLVLSLFVIGYVYAEKALTQDDAAALVKDAAAFLKEKGRDAALEEIGNPNGKFVKAELYVFAYDLEGKMLAHPLKPDLVGKNLINEPDSKGKMFRKDIIDLAKTKGEGWVDYTYMNPKTTKEELKTTYLLKEGDVILCCGIYKTGK